MTQSALQQLARATSEAQQATREARAAARDYRQIVKQARADIDQQIRTEVARQIAALTVDVRREAHDAIAMVVDQVRDHLRDRLGL